MHFRSLSSMTLMLPCKPPPNQLLESDDVHKSMSKGADMTPGDQRPTITMKHSKMVEQKENLKVDMKQSASFLSSLVESFMSLVL